MARGKMAARAAHQRAVAAQQEWDEKELRYKHDIAVLNTELSDARLIIEQLRNKLTREVSQLADEQVQAVRADEKAKQAQLIAETEDKNIAAGQFILTTLDMATHLFGWTPMPPAAYAAMIAEFADLLGVSPVDLEPDGPWAQNRALRRNTERVGLKTLAEYNLNQKDLQRRAHEVLFHSMTKR